jgi:dTDP-4-amino-4,6-dideoxygalactose transaminase
VARDFPQAEDNYSRCISLPIFPDLTDAQCEQVVRNVVQLVEKSRKRAMVGAD